MKGLKFNPEAFLFNHSHLKSSRTGLVTENTHTRIIFWESLINYRQMERFRKAWKYMLRLVVSIESVVLIRYMGHILCLVNVNKPFPY